MACEEVRAIERRRDCDLIGYFLPDGLSAWRPQVRRSGSHRRLSMRLRKAQVRRRHLIGKPDAIVRQKERVSLLVHALGIDAQDDRFAMALPHTMRGRDVDRQVHLLPGSGAQSFRKDRIQESRRGAMEERLRWLKWRQPELHRDRVPLGGTNTLSVIRYRKALLLAGRHHVQQLLASKSRASLVTQGDQDLDRGPSLRIQGQAHDLGLVAKNEAQESTELGVHWYLSGSPLLASAATQDEIDGWAISTPELPGCELGA